MSDVNNKKMAAMVEAIWINHQFDHHPCEEVYRAVKEFCGRSPAHAAMFGRAALLAHELEEERQRLRKMVASFDTARRDSLQSAYDQAVSAKQDCFIFEGDEWATISAEYALQKPRGRA